MNIVEGYVVNPENEWCNPFALGEPKYSTKVKAFSEIPPRKRTSFFQDFHFFFSGETKTERKG